MLRAMGTAAEARALDRLASWGLAIAFAGKAAIVVWALGRGLELGDEGYFLLNLNHPEGAPAVFQFYRLLGEPGRDGAFGVRDARVLRLLVEALASLALVGGIYTWARRRCLASGAMGFAPFLLFCLLGALLSTASRAFGYNDMSSLCSYTAVGALFALAAAGGRRGRSAAAFAAGLACGIALGVKFTSSAALFGLSVLAIAALVPDLVARERARLVALHLAGALAACGLFVLRRGGVTPILEELAAMPELARLSGYGPRAILERYVLGEAWTLIHLAFLAAVVGLVWRRASRPPGRDRDTAAALALLAGAAALAAGTALFHPPFLHPTALALAAFLAFLLLALALAAARAASRPWRDLALLLLLVALPAVNLLGANVTFSMRLPSHALPVFAAIAVLAGEVRARTGAVRTHLAATSILVALTSALFLQHHVRSPYGLARPMWEQRHEAVGLPDVRVDAPTRDFLNALALRLHEAGFSRGAPIAALDYMPGLVTYLGGTSPGANLFMFDKPELNCVQLARARAGAVPFFLLGRPISDAQRACLAPLDFERDLVLVDRIPFPYEAVYAGFDAPGMTHLHVYAPRRREPRGS